MAKHPFSVVPNEAKLRAPAAPSRYLGAIQFSPQNCMNLYRLQSVRKRVTFQPKINGLQPQTNTAFLKSRSSFSSDMSSTLFSALNCFADLRQLRRWVNEFPCWLCYASSLPHVDIYRSRLHSLPNLSLVVGCIFMLMLEISAEAAQLFRPPPILFPLTN